MADAAGALGDDDDETDDERRLRHQMSLGVITLAAGSELVLNQLRLNARAILVLTLSLCVSALVLVSSAMAVLLSYHDAVRWPAAAAHPLCAARWTEADPPQRKKKGKKQNILHVQECFLHYHQKL